MTALAFQNGLARLIIDPDFRDAVRTRGEAVLEGELSALERSRLCCIAADAGMDINRTLHKGFRLGKLRALLPLTCAVLNSQRLSREVAVFWAQWPPSSFYFVPEAIEFCDFLRARRLRVKYLYEVVGYERASLELERARHGAVPDQRVHFQHDPAVLLTTLANGRRPRGIPRRACIVTATKDAAGRVHWELQAGG